MSQAMFCPQCGGPRVSIQQTGCEYCTTPFAVEEKVSQELFNNTGNEIGEISLGNWSAELFIYVMVLALITSLAVYLIPTLQGTNNVIIENILDFMMSPVWP